MPLSAGTRLGSYEILSIVGVGGMGEVYKARDTRLGRIVAIKVLPEHIAGNRDLKQRFEREAKTISSLSHPHICTLHDVGSEGGVEFLVMEFLEGETLAQRLAKGPLALHQVLRIGMEIAEALDRAHRQGITHRDLKPGNVMLTKSGAKLLDFGLAKLAHNSLGRATQGEATATPGATVTPDLTGSGTWIGTLQYMSPEQLEGKVVDHRADVFAFGAIVYEMATGEKAFAGSSEASLIGAILRDEPRPISVVQPLSPAALDALVSTCLAKDPDERWQSMADVGRQLRLLQSGSSQPNAMPLPAIPARRRGMAWAAVTVAAISVLGTLAVVRYWPSGEAMQPVPEAARVAFSFSTPPMHPLNFAVSPNGLYVAFVAGDVAGKESLFVRPIDSLEARMFAETEGAQAPFWSPDSEHLGFVAEGTLKRVARTGGAPQSLARIEAAGFFGGAWSAEGVILFGSGPVLPLRRVAASGGGEPVAATRMRVNDIGHGLPQFLPDGKHFFFQITATSGDGLYMGSLDAAAVEPTLVMADARRGQNANGYLLFTRRDGMLNAQPFDTERLTLAGEPYSVAGPVDTSSGPGAFSASQTGVLAYGPRRPSALADSRLTWYDRAGQSLGSVGEAGVYRGIALSPDDRTIAVHVHEESGGGIWVGDAEVGSFTRLSFEQHDVRPVWSPDGRLILFATAARPKLALYTQASNGSGVADLVFESPFQKFPESWSRDNKALLFTQWGGTDTPGMNVWELPVDGGGPHPVLNDGSNEAFGQVSPDGRWIAYTSDESGREEVRVRSYPDLGGRRLISTGGASYPRWARDGRELFYLSSDGRLMAVAIGMEGDALSPGAPRVLFTINAMLGDHAAVAADIPYDVSSDGQRFLVNERVAPATDAGAAQSSSLTVILNWDKAPRP